MTMHSLIVGGIAEQMANQDFMELTLIKMLATYCLELFSLIKQIVLKPITPSPDLALLNLSIESLSRYYHKIVIHTLLDARLNITKLWKKSTTLSVLDVIKQVQDHFIYETLLAVDRCTYFKQRQAWKP